MLSLKDKVVFMSGAGSVGDDPDAKVWGNGKATAVLLARQGAKVYGVDLRKEAADVTKAIIDKEVRIGRGAKIGVGDDMTPNRACPEHLSSGLVVVGKRARLPEGISVGRNARIGASVTEESFTAPVPSGGVVDGPESMH